MTLLACGLVIAGVAVFIALPFWRVSATGRKGQIASERADTLQHEKAVALLAITEADFDHATGKLDQEDYTSLRGLYEQRALLALEGLDRLAKQEDRGAGDAVPGPVARFCHHCGTRFAAMDRFCRSCGTARAAATSGAEQD